MADSASKKTKKMLVRYGKLGYLGWFTHEEAHIPCSAGKVVIKTERGLEIGEVVGSCGCYSHGNYRGVNSLEEYFELDQPDFPIGDGGVFVRYATHQDLNEARHVRESAGEELSICRRLVRELKLDMKIIEFEHIFGGERIVFYFLAEGRVDFRNLVKELAREFQTRIEMRQIGARDEARLISDIETCGQECCCKRYLKILKPVNMRMAKTQKATLDPSKISGHCGRLRCCLRYEDITYQDLRKNMPNRQSWVKSPSGYGRVIDYQIITQLVRILHEDGKIEAFHIDELEVFDKMPKEVTDMREEQRLREEEREKRAELRTNAMKRKQEAKARKEQSAAAPAEEPQDSEPEDESGEKTEQPKKNRRSRGRRGRGRGKKGGEDNASKQDSSDAPNES